MESPQSAPPAETASIVRLLFYLILLLMVVSAAYSTVMALKYFRQISV
ncbi:MAG TPA: hypothetical protein VF461_01525 [Gemmatimonadaceae bacterium]